VSTWLLRALARCAALLSWRAAQSLGAFLGLVWFHLVRIRRRVVRSNLALALPERSHEHGRIARESYRHLGVSALEFLRLCGEGWDEVLHRVHLHGLESFEQAFARGRGVIVVTAHFGNFDLLACSQALRGVPLAIVSRDLHGGGSNRFWMESRSASGLTIFPDEGGARQVLKWLRRGNVLGLVVDQRTPPGRGGIRVPFFGREVWTSTAAAKLALRTGAALVPARIERRPDGEHDLIVEHEIPAGADCGDGAARELTARVNRVIERWVRERPEHWMWLHRRFADAGSQPGPVLETRP
jgi:KDO2-lipid IV(A) lauroyltransferase